MDFFSTDSAHLITLRRQLLLMVLLLLPWPLSAVESGAITVRIGVLGFRSPQKTLQQWQPTAELLNQKIPGYRFKVVPMNYPQLAHSIANKNIDFVLTNTGHYVKMEVSYGVTRMATLVKSVDGQPIENFGGVVFTRKDRSDINSLADLKQKRFLAVGENSLGGFLVAWQALLEAGVDPYQDFSELSFNGMPHDEVIFRVLNGEADAGTVRTGVLEQLSKEGALRLDEIKVLNSGRRDNFPFLYSTHLFPEWPFSRMPHTSERLAKQVTLVLLNIRADDPAAKAGHYAGWSVPLNYQPVHALMKQLRTGPYEELGQITMDDLLHQYSTTAMALLTLALMVATAVVWEVRRMNRVLRKEVSERRLVEMQLRENEAHLDHLAHHDPLTGLPNRLLCSERLQQAIERSRIDHKLVAVLFLDLDRFKNINDTLGHEIGDLLIRRVGERVVGALRSNDTVARMGGDEFVVILEVESRQESYQLANKLLGVLSEPFNISGYKLNASSSIGISLYPQHGDSISDLMKRADMAMYGAKGEGGNCYKLYSSEMDARGFERLLMEGDLRKAIERNQLCLYFQPQYELQNFRIVGVEVLIRWRHPERGLVMPGEFIPLAEEAGMVSLIGDWVIRETCRQASSWRQQGLPPLRLGINLSSEQLHQPDLPQRIKKTLQEYGIEPAYIDLEITEGTAMRNVEIAVKVMHELRDIGMMLSIDDFGTGYSSLSYLQRFPVQHLKIDKSFISEILSDQQPSPLVRSIITVGQNLGLKIVAEGVERPEQEQFLVNQHCDYAQGFYYSPPLPAGQLAELLERSR